MNALSKAPSPLRSAGALHSEPRHFGVRRQSDSVDAALDKAFMVPMRVRQNVGAFHEPAVVNRAFGPPSHQKSHWKTEGA